MINFKTTLIILLSSLLCLTVNAQQVNILDAPIYKADTAMGAKYCGTWWWSSNGTDVKLTIYNNKRSAILDKNNNYIHPLNIGFLQYAQDGRILSLATVNGVDFNGSLSGFVLKGEPFMHFIFIDASRNGQSRTGTMTFTDSTYNEAVFKINPEELEPARKPLSKQALIDTIPRAINVTIRKVK